MNKNNISVIAASLVAVIAISGVALYSSAAVPEDGNREGRGFFQNLTDEQKEELEAKKEEMKAEHEERRAEMETAIDEGYEAWKALVEENNPDAQVLDVISSENFDEFASAHDKIGEGRELMEEGKAEMEELGVEKQHKGHGKGFKQGMKRGFRMHQNMGEADLETL